MARLLRNYRVLIAALATVMLILLLKASSNSPTSIDISRSVASGISRLENPNEADDSVSALPISNTSGFVADEKTDSKNPELTNALKSATGANCDEKDTQFVIMVDAGSTGSRVHIYEFNTCTSPPTLVKETFDMLKPGLSSFDTDSIGAANSLDPLLQKALDVIPLDKRSCTPIAVKATAGLRLLGEAKSDKTLAAVRSHLENDYPFAVVKGDGISIMSGEEEGVYAWVTTNYLLGNIGSKGDKLPTTAVFDLGGGSTQIVFEPSFPPNEKMVEGEYKYDLSFGGHDYSLYQFSHLGYGLMQGRNKINAVLVETAIKDNKITKGDTTTTHQLVSPCLPPGVSALKETVKLEDGSTYLVDFEGPKVATGAQCRFIADSILNKDAVCSQPPCSFNGVHQPSLVRTFKETSDLYIFSYFYDRTRPLGMPLSFTLNELYDLSRMVCNGEEVWESAFANIDGSIAELKNDPHFCQDLTFQVSLLHTGYDIPLHRELRTAQTINNNELGWCLGASLPLLEGTNWSCKLSKAM
ncbi:hypothetical protein KAFR_0E00480 [Kazachstania africana CBS 2517]|uniref:Guanosine-diphosphatase n=1 Tax=Kazachstania africana (strain ATCC 22294 / BCRC 22015 / CBS 2517 / CECT 1963 / NBRC 1671 / NRRL Y-8276) TaxID=1071382 RepID=H2AV02_KAZAF|nr:hypothetical protein KAFR_0E00480 [Kazachstania africana CBS 2517]CCF58202.1 hypothetical protein KAFR_0E00480 [Kazachstania africana CBS 2517]